MFIILRILYSKFGCMRHECLLVVYITCHRGHIAVVVSKEDSIYKVSCMVEYPLDPCPSLAPYLLGVGNRIQIIRMILFMGIIMMNWSQQKCLHMVRYITNLTSLLTLLFMLCLYLHCSTAP